MIRGVGSIIDSSGLQAMLQSFRKDAGEALEQPRYANVGNAEQVLSISERSEAKFAENYDSRDFLAAHSTSSNPMAGNFFNSSYKRSKYVDATIDSLKNEGDYSGKMTSLVGSLIAQAGVWDLQRNFGNSEHLIENTYVNGTRLATATAVEMERIKQEESGKESKKNLDEIQDDIERRAQESAAPKDENGEPIDAALPGGDGQDAPAPEISTAGSASSAYTTTPVDMAAASMPASAPAELVMGAGDTALTDAAVPATPSVNLLI